MNRKLEMGPHSQLDSHLRQVSTAGCPDIVVVTLFRTTAQRVSCETDMVFVTLFRTTAERVRARYS